MSGRRVAVIGGGLSGLTAACALHERGHEVNLFESADRVGGRVRTDEVGGFLLDRGFQVLLDSYETARRVFDFEGLSLSRFEPGALVFHGGRLHRIVDPARRPGGLIATLRAPVGSLASKLRLLRLKRLARETQSDATTAEDVSTAEWLEANGFDGPLRDRFLNPFFSGVFLDRDLRVSSRFFRFIFDRFARGYATLPAQGMEALPRQLAARLPEGSIHLGARVGEGESPMPGDPDARVIATGPWTRPEREGTPLPEALAVTCLYFACEDAPFAGKMLVLDGEGRGPVTHVAVPSAIARTYAPRGSHLVSATVLGNPDSDDDELRERVLDQMSEWFGAGHVEGWSHLRTYRVKRALPLMERLPVAAASDSIVACGDHLEQPSIEGALVSGLAAAERALSTLAKSG